MMIEKLVEARRLFNELSDKIYAIAYGSLEETDYAVIYQNYEDAVLEEVLGYCRNSCVADCVREDFGAMILDLAQYGYTMIRRNDQDIELHADEEFLNTICDDIYMYVEH